MKKRHTDSEGEDSTVDMTPMLDIVFIMLIFFIVTTSFVKESGVQVNRPTADSAQQDKKGNIMVAIKPNGEVWIDKRAVDIRSVRANIEKLKAESPESGVVIQADTDARTGMLVEVMDQIRLAGIMNISLAATPGS
ncbi:biopolymer transporter ExbD [Bermanella marisrubri]|uniref:TonB system transport protein ExbD2 n=1 Tax=Bermanella marisrubri TaxID=207949 RepID=Q1N4L4_9GAMM|nr:biopolymer transporter ExbD [Bermanella marisrubri]EAT13414.1 TonB system transport protein ExbD2 [Oceanobacter sp. RED65] [Bermanella marisrubri]QIZ84164.1 biopolymer transporter ExbD [Bermanella marisrubri]